MLENLHRAVRIAKRLPGISASQRAVIAAQHPALPPQWLDLFADSADLELFFKRGYLRLRNPAREPPRRVAGSSLGSQPVLVGENACGDAIIVAQDGVIHRIPEDAWYDAEDADDIEEEQRSFVAPDVKTLLSDAAALSAATGAVARHPWRSIRQWRRLHQANVQAARFYLWQAAVFSVTTVALAMLHFGWPGLVLGVAAVVVVHRITTRGLPSKGARGGPTRG
jgi:hypothetical protein